MKNVCIVTGGGSGMGLAAAKLIGRDHYILLVGRTASKLEGALAELRASGAEAGVFPCDASDREAVKALCAHAQTLGTVRAVLHSAGMSPNMGSAETIFTVNAMGTINICEEFAKIMPKGGCILNVASMAGYMLPPGNVPHEVYALSLSDTEAFHTQMLGIVSSLPEDIAAGSAYTMSKNFVIWYSERLACIHGKNGVRVLSISPGTFSTPMGEIEGRQAAAIAESGALGRVGDPDEIAVVMEFLLSEKCSYITGTDILCDGGTIAAMRAAQE